MAKNCFYCKKEIDDNCVVDMCLGCMCNVWGEKMSKAIIANMEKERSAGNLELGRVGEESIQPKEVISQPEPMQISSQSESVEEIIGEPITEAPQEAEPQREFIETKQPESQQEISIIEEVETKQPEPTQLTSCSEEELQMEDVCKSEEFLNEFPEEAPIGESTQEVTEFSAKSFF